MTRMKFFVLIASLVGFILVTAAVVLTIFIVSSEDSDDKNEDEIPAKIKLV